MTPTVLTELETVRLLCEGKSLARFGDGELGIAVMNRGAPGQAWALSLARRLRWILASDMPDLVVAIPNLWNSPIPKHMARNWSPWLQSGRMRMYRRVRIYGSAFVSRPDFYGQPFGMDYWNMLRSIWEGRPVLAVRGGGLRPKNLVLFDNAADLRLIACLPRDAWSEYDRLLRDCAKWAEKRNDPVVCLMCGPTATVLAHGLCQAGVQALDLGKAPRFYRKEMEQV